MVTVRTSDSAENGASRQVLKFHELAKLVPMPSDEEFALLAQSIKEYGLVEQIVILDGKILDGRSRYLAGQAVEYQFDPAGDFRDFDAEIEGDPAVFVLCKNAHRRSLTKGQRVALGVELYKRMQQRKPGNPELQSKNVIKKGSEQLSGIQDNWTPAGTTAKENLAKAAAAAGVSVDTMQKAAQVEKTAPDVFAELKDNKISVNAAARKTRTRKLQRAETGVTAEAHDEAQERVEKVCGPEFAAAIRGDQVNGIKTPAAIVKFAGFSAKKMLAMMPGLAQGWSLEKAAGFLGAELSLAHTLLDLTEYLLSRECLSVTINLHGIEFTVVDKRSAEQKKLGLPQARPLFGPWNKKTKVVAEPVPSRDQVMNFVTSQGYDGEKAGDLYDVWLSGGWRTTKGQPITNWRALVLIYAKAGYWPFGSKNGNGNGNGGHYAAGSTSPYTKAESDRRNRQIAAEESERLRREDEERRRKQTR
jgi:hypothetical protein